MKMRRHRGGPANPRYPLSRPPAPNLLEESMTLIEAETTGHGNDALKGHTLHAGRRQGAILPSHSTSTTPPVGKDIPAAIYGSLEKARSRAPQDGEGEAVHSASAHHLNCDRFADPLIAEIVETWRSRQDMVRAQSRLTLQAKAICRRFCEGDKKEADKLYRAIIKDGDHPSSGMASLAVLPLLMASEPLKKTRAAYEKRLTKLGKELPIAHMAERIKGVSTLTLAVIAGELGDMSAYEKGISGIWKRAGLAVIDGERQRKKASTEGALLHGYSPSRRSTFWNMADALLKAQGKDENAGPYRLIYDARKAYERPRVESDGHAHNRAMRFMMKRLLKDLWKEWSATSPAAS